MRITAPCIAAAFSAALAACCLAAGHGHAPAVRPVLPAVQSCPALQSAGQALTVLRRRTLAAARRTAQALLLCLAAAAAALTLPAGAELWVEPQALPCGCPAGATPPGPAAVHRPAAAPPRPVPDRICRQNTSRAAGCPGCTLSPFLPFLCFRPRSPAFLTAI